MIALAQSIILITCTACAAALDVYWGIVAFHVARTFLTIPTARRGLRLAARNSPLPATTPSVCVVIPAHNEEAVIATLARSLIAQDYPDLRVVFALDRCTDGTSRVLKEAVGADPRVEVLDIDQCPSDWAGKVHAIWRGIEDSRQGGGARAAELLLFIDADTSLHPGCIRACVALLEDRGLGMLSLLSTLSHDRWFEAVAQPAATMELIRQYPITRANSIAHRRPFANGQFMLFRRDLYDAIGGHQAVREAILEDIQLARLVAHHPHERESSGRAGLFLADGLLHCRMYGSWPEFVGGWKRIYIESTNRKPSRMRTQAARVRLLGAFLPAACVVGLAAATMSRGGSDLASAAIWACASALAVFFATILACHAAGRMPLWHVPAYPLGAWLIGSILHEAAADLDAGKTMSWGGREYKLEARP